MWRRRRQPESMGARAGADPVRKEEARPRGAPVRAEGGVLKARRQFAAPVFQDWHVWSGRASRGRFSWYLVAQPVGRRATETEGREECRPLIR